MAFRIYPYNEKSKSANALKDALSATFIDKDGELPAKEDIVINWGCGYKKPSYPCINKDLMVGIDKRQFFQKMHAIGVGYLLPECWLTSSLIAEDDFPVVCRTVLDGKDGEGIVIAKNKSELVSAGLYTKLISATKEFRIHVGRDSLGAYSIILVQRKGKLNGSKNTNTTIKTGSNDYVFVHGETAPQVCLDAAIEVFSRTGMDFGGLDVIYDGTNAYILEVNSAPELGKIAANAYADFFKDSYSLATEDSENAVNSYVEASHAVSVSVPVSGVSKESQGSAILSSSGDNGIHNLSQSSIPKLSGGDIFGLMADLDIQIQKKVQEAFAKGIAEGIASAKLVTMTSYQDGYAKGITEMKAKFQQLLAA